MKTLPFFARYLTRQDDRLPVKSEEKGGARATSKYPSDRDEFVTLKYPSDDDEGGVPL